MKIKLSIICLVSMLFCSTGSSGFEPVPNLSRGVQSARLAANPLYNCPAVSRPGKRQIKSQTFPFNFQPFNDTCFVTFGSTEAMLDEKDLPRGSTFHLYRNGQAVLDLPDGFDGQEGCWVEAVAFKDLNRDGLTDIIIAGKCLGARDSYPQNAIFVNTGKDFTTNSQANQRLESFTKLSAIETFVKRNLKIFF